MTETPFRMLRAFNDPQMAKLARSRSNVDHRATRHFDGDTLQERFVRALAEWRAISIKEMVEAFEFFTVTRKHLRVTALADLCAGHGLAGILFAMFERRLEQVVLVDRTRPKRHDRVWAAAVSVAPWIEAKVRYVESDLKTVANTLPPGSGVIAVHACGALTDRAIDIGIECVGPLALLPCCHADSQSDAPVGLKDALGLDIACDVQRSYRLEAAGWAVRWRAIPEAITPKNRILMAKPRPTAAAEA